MSVASAKQTGGATNRREFLQTCALGAAALSAGHATAFGSGALRLPPSRYPDKPSDRSRVVIARDAMLRGSGSSLDSDRLLKLLDRALVSFCACDSAQEAWKRVARPGECVGLKINCLAGRGASTTVKLVEVVVERLQQAGVTNIVIWDRLNSDLESAGFRIASSRPGVQFIGNDTGGYEDQLSIHSSVGSLLARTLTRTCDAVISLPVLKDHGIAGMTFALKNFFGAIHNPNKYHLTVGDPYVADVNMLPAIRQKIRLHIGDATAVQYEGGPSYMPQWSWRFNGLIVGTDPVALDAVGWQLIEQKRAAEGMQPLAALKRAPTYISTAADPEHRLGANDPRRIERLEV